MPGEGVTAAVPVEAGLLVVGDACAVVPVFPPQAARSSARPRSILVKQSFLIEMVRICDTSS